MTKPPIDPLGHQWERVNDPSQKKPILKCALCDATNFGLRAIRGCVGSPTDAFGLLALELESLDQADVDGLKEEAFQFIDRISKACYAISRGYAPSNLPSVEAREAAGIEAIKLAAEPSR